MAIRAVITGDIVNSTQLATVKEKKLLNVLKNILVSHQFEFYRGDSFQVYQKSAEGALKTALLCRTAAISVSQDNKVVGSDIRLSIGIGQASTASIKSLGTAKGEAFLLSGRAFDDIANSNTRLVIATGDPLANEGLQVIADYINAIFNVMTGKQASVIFELLNGKSQQSVAAKMKKSKSTISQHVSSGRWQEIERLLQQFENIIKQIS